MLYKNKIKVKVNILFKYPCLNVNLKYTSIPTLIYYAKILNLMLYFLIKKHNISIMFNIRAYKHTKENKYC